MSGVRIYDLAKELHLANHDILEMLKALGEDGKTPSSAVNEETADAVRRQAGSPAKAAGNGTAAVLSAPVVSPTAVGTSESNGTAPPPKNGTSSNVSPPAPKPESLASPAPPPAVAEPPKTIDIPDVVSLKDFAQLIGIPAPDIQKKLMGLGVLAPSQYHHGGDISGCCSFCARPARRTAAGSEGGRSCRQAAPEVCWAGGAPSRRHDHGTR
jgi:hypothetical protein